MRTTVHNLILYILLSAPFCPLEQWSLLHPLWGPSFAKRAHSVRGIPPEQWSAQRRANKTNESYVKSQIQRRQISYDRSHRLICTPTQREGLLDLFWLINYPSSLGNSQLDSIQRADPLHRRTGDLKQNIWIEFQIKSIIDFQIQSFRQLSYRQRSEVQTNCDNDFDVNIEENYRRQQPINERQIIYVNGRQR